MGPAADKDAVGRQKSLPKPPAKCEQWPFWPCLRGRDRRWHGGIVRPQLRRGARLLRCTPLVLASQPEPDRQAASKPTPPREDAPAGRLGAEEPARETAAAERLRTRVAHDTALLPLLPASLRPLLLSSLEPSFRFSPFPGPWVGRHGEIRASTGPHGHALTRTASRERSGRLGTRTRARFPQSVEQSRRL